MMENRWWSADPDEIFWLETTDREDLGANLNAPQLGDNGKPSPGYSLLCEVQPGDIVFHYQKRGQAIVAWSRAVGAPWEEDVEWVPHSASSRRLEQRPRPRPGWWLELEGPFPLGQSVTLADLRAQEAEIKAGRSFLEDSFADTLYFPFALSDKRPIRPTQAYMTKWPRSLALLFPSMAAVVTSQQPRALVGNAIDDPVDAALEVATGIPKGQAWHSSLVARLAIERIAMDRAINHYSTRGWNVEDVSGNHPYDLVCRRAGDELHVEVKGTVSPGHKILLSRNEVRHVREQPCACALFVLRNIILDTVDGQVRASGGDAVVTDPWVLDEECLYPLTYEYELAED